MEELRKFCGAFKHIPVLVKIPRELSWLPSTSELDEFLRELREHGSSAVIIANSEKMDIPTFLVEGVEKTLQGGVICGERLFDGTVTLIGGFKEQCEGYDVPIVASGGMVHPEQILVAMRAGASAVQLCTAFDYFGIEYYQTLCWNVQNRIESRGLRSMSEYEVRLRAEGVASIYAMPFMYFQHFYDDEPQKRMKIDVRRSRRMDAFVMSGRTLVDRWQPEFSARFASNRSLRLLVPRTDGPMYEAVQRSWGITDKELEARRERVQAAKISLRTFGGKPKRLARNSSPSLSSTSSKPISVLFIPSIFSTIKFMSLHIRLQDLANLRALCMCFLLVAPSTRE